jgi:D-alanine-D-alanine ligase
MGGRSSEHEVSLSSAAAVLAALGRTEHEVVPIVIAREGAWLREGAPVMLGPGPDGRARLLPLGEGGTETIDLVFPVLHGPFGEDGTVQGLCETAGVPYVGAGVAASAVAIDKSLFKVVLAASGLPFAEYATVDRVEWERDHAGVRLLVDERVGFPCFVKPTCLGSSVGISRVPDPGALGGALELAFVHGPRALVERAIVGREVEVGVLGNRELEVSPVGEISYDAEWYDYETKYQDGRMRLQVPADLPADLAGAVRGLAAGAFRAADCRGMARVDFFIDNEGRALVSELNTIPGFTPTSVYAKLMEAGGVDYDALVARLVELGLEEGREAARYRC